MNGIWIRTQDKRGLIHAQRIAVEEFKEFGTDKYKYHVINQIYFKDSNDDYVNDYDLLGIYDTEERAIEVLDDIQQHHFSSLLFGAYEMPEE